MKKTVLGYARLSKRDGASHSISYQKSEIKKFAEKEGFRLVGVEVDEGKSGKSLKGRTGVQRIIEAIDGQLVDAIVVFRSDRLSRDGLDSLKLEKKMSHAGISYLSVTEGSLIEGDPLLRHVRIGMNESERWKVSVRTKAALREKREKGQRIGGQVRYGWMVVDKKLVPHPEEQKIIERIVLLRSEGLSTKKVAEVITDEGFRTRKGTPFTRNQVIRILNYQNDRSSKNDRKVA